jgi:gamma-glutamyltranspeptidase/glutathione hydrolase
MQPQGHVQVLVNMIDFGLNVQASADAGRVRHDGSQTPTSQPMGAGGGEVNVESSIPQATIEELAKRGHHIVHKADGGFGGYQGIWIDQLHGTIHGGTEPRTDGAAVGY